MVELICIQHGHVNPAEIQCISVYCHLLTIAKIWNQPKCLFAGWQLNKMWFLEVTDDGTEFCPVIRKKEVGLGDGSVDKWRLWEHKDLSSDGWPHIKLRASVTLVLRRAQTGDRQIPEDHWTDILAN